MILINSPLQSGLATSTTYADILKQAFALHSTAIALAKTNKTSVRIRFADGVTMGFNHGATS